MKKVKVAIIRCENYDQDKVDSAVRKGIDLIGGIGQFVKPKEKILLKPNVLWSSEPEKCIVTHFSVFKAVATILKQQECVVSYGDSPGGPLAAAGAMKKPGFSAVAEELNLTFGDFDHGQDVSFPEGISSKRIHIANAVLASDGLISIPKLKSHGLTRITGAVKNQYGCIPGLIKGQYHARFPDIYEFSKLLVDINRLIKPRLFVMDAVMAMEGNGPQSGDPKKVGAIIISSDPVALDAVVCKIVNLKTEYVPTLEAGHKAGLGTCDFNEIEICGDAVEQFIDLSFKVVRKPVDPMPQSRFLTTIRRHFLPRPVIDSKKCINCKRCVEVCPVDPKAVFSEKGRKTPHYDYGRCIRCFCCHEMCPAKAIHIKDPLMNKLLPLGSYISLILSGRHSKKSSKHK
jgi:uncharacterized protein (DUF362 family)/Pyruvate/2-oxoacid:ferredoxin oxidoreductase delta subunit